MNGERPPLRIAIVDGDTVLRDGLRGHLARCGHNVWGAESAELFYRRLAVEPVDVVLLDIGLPGEDGFTAARYIRANTQIVVIFVTARDAVEDRVRGMECGAAGYLVKPVSLRELQAVIEAAWRRHTEEPLTNSVPMADGNTAPHWRFNTREWSLTSPDGETVTLSGAEYALLDALMARPGEAVRRDVLFDAIGRPPMGAGDRRIDTILSRLRTKFGHPLPIRAIRGHGYLFDGTVVVVNGQRTCG